MRRLMAIAISAASLSFAAPLTAATLEDTLGNGAAYVGLHGGTLGLGVNAGYDFSNDLAIRGLVNYFTLDFDKEKAGNKYEGELDLRSLGLVLDWHPFWGAFRVTGGGFLNRNRLSASTQGMDLGIGLGTYDADLNFQMDFEKAVPYVGIGWTSGRGRGGLAFTADIGALFRSSPRVSASGRALGGAIECEFSVSRDGDAEVHCPDGRVPDELLKLGSNLQDEHQQLLDDLDKLKVYPVVSLGVSYRF